MNQLEVVWYLYPKDRRTPVLAFFFQLLMVFGCFPSTSAVLATVIPDSRHLMAISISLLLTAAPMSTSGLSSDFSPREA